MAKSPRSTDPSEEPDEGPVTQDTQTAQAVVVKRKGRVPAAAWIAAMVVLGGVAAAVVLVVLKPGEGGEPAATTAPATESGSAAADAGTSDEVADGASDDAAEAADGAVEVDEVVEVAEAEGEAEAEAAEGEVEIAEVEASDDVAGEVDEVQGVVEVASDDAVAAADGAPVADAAPGDVSVTDAAADAPSAPETVAITIDPKESTRLNDQGLAARKAGDHKGALAAYEKAVQTNPDNVWARYNYACELALAGKKKEALAELTVLYKAGTSDAKKALAAARKDSDFASIRDMGQFFRLTNF